MGTDTSVARIFYDKNFYNKNMIDIGDTVSVHFNNAQFTLSRKAKVVFMANGIGDFWGFEDLENGMIHYVSEPCTITKETIDKEDIPF